METKDPKSSESAGGAEVESKDPKSDATSTETLSEIEEGEEISEEDAGTADSNDTSSSPSPDGAFDDGRGGTSGIDDAGPM